ncbi:MAG TPA: DUF3422 family protein, partial [Pseudomonadales bacterium]|nr:DUF3422 family protein [Pseudomonadales bacterium]
ELTQQHLNAVAAKLEEAIAGSHFRFSASRAYSNIMERRLRDLHERSFESIHSFSEFMERRISPALATVESVRSRLQELSMNLQRTSSLLRTRIEMNLLKQNQGLLAALNKRADAQLRLQETVEGLSVAVLSYYSVSLLHYVLEGAEHMGMPVSAAVGSALAVPVVLIGLLIVMRRVRKRLFGDVTA